MPLRIPRRLADTCARTLEHRAWLQRLPGMLEELQQRWSLSLAEPFDGEELSCAWVAAATRPDGSSAVLKLGMIPHMEGEHEIRGLRFWDGDPTVRLLEADEDLNAMLIEHCRPGTHLRRLPEPEQDEIIAQLMRRLWRRPEPSHGFRLLSEMMARWRSETLAEEQRWPDKGLVREGLRLFEELPRTGPDGVLLATDLHAGNVLRAEREPWLVIDPKPFVGDPAYDTTQHLFNCSERLFANPRDTIARFADRVELDRQRIRLWIFARAAAESRDNWETSESFAFVSRFRP